MEKFAALPLLVPDRQDYIDAAALRNLCRRAGVQMGTIDALLAQLCVRHDLTLLTTDGDFLLAAKHCSLRVWKPPQVTFAPQWRTLLSPKSLAGLLRDSVMLCYAQWCQMQRTPRDK